MSLRERLNALGIDGHTCEALIREFYALAREYPQARISDFIRTVRDSIIA